MSPAKHPEPAHPTILVWHPPHVQQQVKEQRKAADVSWDHSKLLKTGASGVKKKKKKESNVWKWVLSECEAVQTCQEKKRELPSLQTQEPQLI